MEVRAAQMWFDDVHMGYPYSFLRKLICSTLLNVHESTLAILRILPKSQVVRQPFIVPRY
jgi:hypothetical protein